MVLDRIVRRYGRWLQSRPTANHPYRIIVIKFPCHLDTQGTRFFISKDVQAAVTEYVDIRREAGDPVVLDDGTGPACCHCAPIAFRRILSNLIDNAIRCGTRARLSVRLAEDVVLIVDDDGPGIPGDKIEAMTEPFERLEPSRRRRTGGAGLGVSIVKALV